MIVSVKLCKANPAVCGILYTFFKDFVFCFRDAGVDVYFSAELFLKSAYGELGKNVLYNLIV